MKTNNTARISSALLRKMMAPVILASCLFSSASANAAQIYFNGFETDTAGWTAPIRVASGTGGVTSSSGSFHALADTDFTRWGGYNFGAGATPTPFQEYTTSIDIYLDVNGNWANNTRFDFSSAINNAGGTHLSDFIFNGGFYNDATGPGANTSRFVFSASNNSQPGSAFPKNPARDPIAISTTGWYTFHHRFYDDGGNLAVDMSILDSSDVVVNDWTLATAFGIPTVGGNRYGWFDFNEFDRLAIDNSELNTAVNGEVPEPATLALLGLGMLGLSFGRRKQH